MQEFLLLPLVALASIVILPLALIGLTILGAFMYVGEKQGRAKIGGLHRDDDHR